MATFSLSFKLDTDTTGGVTSTGSVADADAPDLVAMLGEGHFPQGVLVTPAQPEVPPQLVTPAVPAVMADDGVTVVTPAVPAVYSADAPAQPAVYRAPTGQEIQDAVFADFVRGLEDNLTTWRRRKAEAAADAAVTPPTVNL